MNDPLILLRTPLGEPGSGRVRYGAAMALYRRGLLSEEAVEVYRICSPLDAQDPAPLLLERGLRPIPKPGRASARLDTLFAEADRYLSHLSGPGVTEVRLGLARAVAAPVSSSFVPNAVVEACLGAALGSLDGTHPALATAIAAAASHLNWITYDDYPPEEIGAVFANSHAFASLVGECAPYHAGDFDFGLFLMAPNLLYRDHAHPAPELYMPLTGPHGWRFAPGAPLTILNAHDPIWNGPNQPHLTKVGPLPFLCLYGWTQDAQIPARVVHADDWAELESRQL